MISTSTTTPTTEIVVTDEGASKGVATLGKGKESIVVKYPKTVAAIGAISAGIFGASVMSVALLLTIGTLPVSVVVGSGLGASALFIATILMTKKLLSKSEPSHITNPVMVDLG